MLDVGCGRGEFLALLREHGISAAVDVNPAMVEVCRANGLDAVTTDALAYLRTLPDGSLGGLLRRRSSSSRAAHLTQLLDAAFDKLRPGAPIVSRLNPPAGSRSRKLHPRPDAVRPCIPHMKYLLIATVFQHGRSGIERPIRRANAAGSRDQDQDQGSGLGTL